MLQCASPDETTAVFLCIALQPVVTVVVKEQLHILVRCIIQTVFESYIVEERLVAIGILCTCRHLSSHRYLHPVIPEPLGETEGVVGMHGTRSIGSIIQTDGEVEGAQRITCDIVDLVLEEAAQGTVHGESAGVAISQIHTCSEHGNR